MSRENEDFHGKFLNFTREYLCVTMHGPPCVIEVILELYHISAIQSSVGTYPNFKETFSNCTMNVCFFNFGVY